MTAWSVKPANQAVVNNMNHSTFDKRLQNEGYCYGMCNRGIPNNSYHKRMVASAKTTILIAPDQTVVALAGMKVLIDPDWMVALAGSRNDSFNCSWLLLGW